MTRWAAPIQTARQGAADRPVLFLDRDGVLLVEKDYLNDPANVQFLPGVCDALARARAAGFLLIGVSNQSGLGRGRITSEAFAAVMHQFTDDLAAAGSALDAFYYCPHAPGDGCECRKPRPGLLLEAAVAFAWDTRRAWVIGDKISDVDLALGAGLRPVLVRTGYGCGEQARLGDRAGVLVVDDLAAAVAAILAEARA